MQLQSIVRSQYLAALAMLKLSVERCPDALWDQPGDATPFWRLAYHALTRQYRLSQDGIIQPFDSVDEALRTMARLRGWRVVDDGELDPDVTYDARVRLKLDTTRLPKPFQIGGLASRDWTPQAEWKQFKFKPTPRSAQ